MSRIPNRPATARWAPIALMALLAIVAVRSSVVAEEARETAKRLEQDLKYLSADDREGRGVGTEGLNQAADFVRGEFEKAGLSVNVLGESAFQKFTIVTGSELGDNNELQLVGPDDQEFELVLDADYQVCSFGGSDVLDAPVVFCGFGIIDQKSGYNDFKDLDLKGKVALIMRRTPRQDQPNGPFAGGRRGISRHAELRTKVAHATRHGAVAVIFVNDPHSVAKDGREQLDEATRRVVKLAEELIAAETGSEQEEQLRTRLSRAVEQLREARDYVKNGGGDQLMEFGYGGHTRGKTVPIVHLRQKVCDRLLVAALKKSLGRFETEINSDLKPRSAELSGWKLAGEVSVRAVTTEVQNVIGVLEGRGPLAEETIVIGAHYDHVGMGGSGSLARGVKAVHNGADDNGSGTVALIELARRFANADEAPRRRMAFIAFTAEEMGLIGSKRYVENPVFPLEKTVAMFNMDMVGRLTDNQLTVFGSGTAPRWEPTLERIGQTLSFDLNLKPEGFGPSDHSSFYGKKIPVLHFFTGTHGDYHRPTDDWDKVNYEGMSRIVDLMERVIRETDQNPQRPAYVAITKPAQVVRSGNRPYFGSIADLSSQQAGYSISGVVKGSPAEQAGIQGGDLLVQFGSHKISGLDDFDVALRKFEPGDEVDVVVTRNDEQIKLKVQLQKPQ